MATPEADSQNSSTASPFLLFPRTVVTAGLGEQGTALPSADDAMRFNPARLVCANGAEVNYLRFPEYEIIDGFTISSVGAVFAVDGVGSFGLEYVRETTPGWTYGPGATQSNVEGAFSLAYARAFSEDFSAGIQARYVNTDVSTARSNVVLFSGGLWYRPAYLGSRLSLGFSLTDFGAPVGYALEEPQLWTYPPEVHSASVVNQTTANLNLGLFDEAVKTDHVDIGLGVELTKPISHQDKNGNAQSSFDGIFTDGNDVFAGMGVHTGVVFTWNPLPLGDDWSLFQQISIGNVTWGPNRYFSNFFTEGLTLGVGWRGLVLSAGFATYFHSNYEWYYPPWVLPREMFQLALKADPSLIGYPFRPPSPLAPLNRLQLSAGIGYSVPTDWTVESTSPESRNLGITSRNDASYWLEGPFYISEWSALVSDVRFTSISSSLKNSGNFRTETVAFSSSYRYHFIRTAAPLFVQAGLGVARSHSFDVFTFPEYGYRTIFAAGAGVDVVSAEGIVVTASVDFTLMFGGMQIELMQTDKYSQADFTLKVGYEFH